jgi:hypothetical protein
MMRNAEFHPLAPRQRGEGLGEGNLLSMNLPSRREPPLPGPLLHKHVEDREMCKLLKSELRPFIVQTPIFHGNARGVLILCGVQKL